MKKKEKLELEDDLFLSAREHNLFLGHEDIEKKMVNQLTSERLHHSWLIEGMKGIGKATLGWRIARFLLASGERSAKNLAIDKTIPAWTLTMANSHPDFLYIAPQAESKTQTITVDEIRKVNSFFTKSPALSKYRVCLIDAIDNMNTNAANALLKLLEEPPELGMIFLISHSAGSVLPTIRSRCTKLKLPPLSDQAIAQLLKEFLPHLTQIEISIATELGNHSAGKALNFASLEGRNLYNTVQKLVSNLAHPNLNEMQSFCGTLTDNHKYQIFCDLMLDWGYKIATKTNAHQKGLEFWDELNEIIRITKRLNMDKKLAAQNIFLALEKLAA